VTDSAAPILSSHEVEVLALLAHGEPGTTAAVQLGISLTELTGTVLEIRRRLGVSSTAAAVAIAEDLGLLSRFPPPSFSPPDTASG
jgi:DNA-binding NarL/FixJ family response regulator